jgi:hypothetical protein
MNPCHILAPLPAVPAWCFAPHMLHYTISTPAHMPTFLIQVHRQGPTTSALLQLHNLLILGVGSDLVMSDHRQHGVLAG